MPGIHTAQLTRLVLSSRVIERPCSATNSAASPRCNHWKKGLKNVVKIDVGNVPAISMLQMAGITLRHPQRRIMGGCLDDTKPPMSFALASVSASQFEIGLWIFTLLTLNMDLNEAPSTALRILTAT